MHGCDRTSDKVKRSLATDLKLQLALICTDVSSHCVLCCAALSTGQASLESLEIMWRIKDCVLVWTCMDRIMIIFKQACIFLVLCLHVSMTAWWFLHFDLWIHVPLKTSIFWKEKTSSHGRGKSLILFLPPEILSWSSLICGC